MPEFDQSLYWKLVPYFCVPMERVHVILVVSGPLTLSPLETSKDHTTRSGGLG